MRICKTVESVVSLYNYMVVQDPTPNRVLRLRSLTIEHNAIMCQNSAFLVNAGQLTPLCCPVAIR